MPLQCLGRRHTITMSWKTTCHCNVSEKDMPENILRKTTCQCNVSENAMPLKCLSENDMPLQCLSEDDMPLQCLPDKSDGCLPLPHHVLSSAVAISAKLKIIFLPNLRKLISKFLLECIYKYCSFFYYMH